MIYIMMKPVSGKCNMRCEYCFYFDEISKREVGDYGKMEDCTLEQIIKKAICSAKKECVFAYQGGEPTLAGLAFFEKSIEYQKKYNIHKIQIKNVIQTNGYLLNESWCKFFGENQFLIGVSLDGIKATHDKLRKTQLKEDTYFKIIDNIQLLKKYNVEFNILTVVNKFTAAKIERIYEAYKKMDFRYQQYINCIEPYGEVAGEKDYSLSADEYGDFLCRLFELWKLDYEKGNKIYIRQFENWFDIINGKIPEACEQRGICGVQTIIEADGSVFPCDFYAFERYKVGDINIQTLEEILDYTKKSGFLEKSYNHSQECLDCKFFSICRGGCNRHRVNGMNIYCKGYYRFFEKNYNSLVVMAQQYIYNR